MAATYTYDGLDRLTRLKDAKGTTVIADNQYAYNNAGDITQNIDQSGTHGYGYDTIQRLTSATYTGTPNESYAYDSVGNRTSSHKSPTYGYQPNNRLVSTSTATYIYNNNGNMVSKTEATGTTQYVWDFENRLTQVVTPSSGSVTYKYDALGRRIQRTPSSGISTNFVYDGQDVVKDINSDGTTLEYLNGPGIDNKIRQKGSSTSTTYYFSQDHLGSTTALTGTTGKLVERVTYDGYGNNAGSTRTRYGYTGRERDQLTSQLYYRARFYDPQLGRFTSEDPIAFSGGINSYAYVDNNPLGFTDPSGLCSQEPTVGPGMQHWLDVYNGCVRDHFGKSSGVPIPTHDAASIILTISSLEGTAESLLAVTWASESPNQGFGQYFNSNPNDGSYGNADVGPFQLNFRTYGDDPRLAGLGDVFGGTTTGSELFRGDPTSNGRMAARILNGYGGGRRAAILFTTGTGSTSRSAQGRARAKDRGGKYDRWRRKYDDFFKCLKDRR